MISVSAGEAGKRALAALTKLCNFLMKGKVPEEILPILYGASLCALNKRGGGIRPIATGNVIRRLTGHILCNKGRPQIETLLRPHQVGVATKRGAEIAIHTARTYVHDPCNKNKVLLKIDYKNAFNSIDRDKMLTPFKQFLPEFYPFMYQCYRNPSLLFYGDSTIDSEVGAMQGDPCGPLAFSLTIQPIVQIMKSQLKSGRRHHCRYTGKSPRRF